MNQKDIQSDTKLRFYVAHDELFIDLILYQFGWEQCSPLHQFGPAKRNHFLFHYVLSGKGRLETSGQTFYLGAHQGFLLCPDQISSYYADPDDPWKYVWLEFDGMRARECMKLAGLSEHQPVYTPISADNTAVPERMLQIVDSHEKSPIHLIGLGMLFMDELVSTSKTKVTETRRKLRDFYMRESLSYIEGNYQRDLSIEEIADVSGLNRSYFSRLFKETFGKSPQAFLIQYRMNKAAELLKRTKQPIAEIGSSVGYDNPLHFSRAFKNTLGISPSEYRKEYRIFTDQ